MIRRHPHGEAEKIHGYRMITAELKRRTCAVNARRVRRLMHEENLVIAVRRYVSTSRCARDRRDWPNLLKNKAITKLNEAWAADSTYVELGRALVYLAVIIDQFSRGIRGGYLGSDLSSELTHRALDGTLAKHDASKIHHSDHGVPYLSEGYLEKLAHHGIAVSCSAKGKPTPKGICERFIRTLKESEARLQDYEDLADARGKIRKFLEDVSMRKRLHWALGYVTPAELEASCRAKTTRKSRRGCETAKRMPMESLPARRKPRRSVLRAVFGFPKSIRDPQSVQLSKPVFVSSPRGAVQGPLRFGM
jgi:putative transposase